MFTFFQYFVSRVYTMICVKSQILQRLTYAALTIVPFFKKNLLLFNYRCMPFFKDTWTKHRGREVGSTIVPFKHSSESPPGTLLPMLVECLRIFHICKSPGPVLEKASKKLLNILENKTLIFFRQLPWGCSRLVRHSQFIFSKHPCVV